MPVTPVSLEELSDFVMAMRAEMSALETRIEELEKNSHPPAALPITEHEARLERLETDVFGVG